MEVWYIPVGALIGIAFGIALYEQRKQILAQWRAGRTDIGSPVHWFYRVFIG